VKRFWCPNIGKKRKPQNLRHHLRRLRLKGVTAAAAAFAMKNDAPWLSGGTEENG
jgi:hypothetical protein